MRISDWSSDVCSSDLFAGRLLQIGRLDDVGTGPRRRERIHSLIVEPALPDPSGRGIDVDGHPVGQRPLVEEDLKYDLLADGRPEGTRTDIRVKRDRQDVEPELGRSEERRVGKSVSVRVDLGGRRIIKKKNTQNKIESQYRFYKDK